jgi:hypothetical protein
MMHGQKNIKFDWLSLNALQNHGARDPSDLMSLKEPVCFRLMLRFGNYATVMKWHVTEIGDETHIPKTV